MQSGPTDSSSNDDISSSDSDDRNNSPPDPTFFVPKSNQHIDGSYSAHNEVVVGHEHPHIPPNIVRCTITLVIHLLSVSCFNLWSIMTDLLERTLHACDSRE